MEEQNGKQTDGRAGARTGVRAEGMTKGRKDATMSPHKMYCPQSERFARLAPAKYRIGFLKS